jgi:SNF2 family DNA or RNA helicase
MGKTAVCISLMLANRPTDKKGHGVTVVLTANSLLGQWNDEIAKFAPSLTVYSVHSSIKNPRNLTHCNADVVLSTIHSGVPSDPRQQGGGDWIS